jgi:type II restriction enzyme
VAQSDLVLNCDTSVARGYKSSSQISRVVSERWFSGNGFCLSCNCESLSPTPANTRAADFECPTCAKRYELKTFRNFPQRRLIDGAYTALTDRILNGTTPTLVLLHRDNTWHIQNLVAVHPSFLTLDVVERRRPLAQSARRAGWVGCNIRLDLLGTDARIPIVEHGVSVDRAQIRSRFKQFERLSEIPPTSRGWTTLTLSAVRRIGQVEFSLDKLYSLESSFAAVFPNNKNIRAKLRQQLQVLRDIGYIEFIGKGKYRLAI